MILEVIAFIILLFCSLYDIKHREVPDLLSYGLMFLAISLRIVFSIYNQSFDLFLSGVIGLFIFYLIAPHTLVL